MAQKGMAITQCSHFCKAQTKIPKIHNYEKAIIKNTDSHDKGCKNYRANFLVRYGGSSARTIMEPRFKVFMCRWQYLHKPTCTIEGMLAFHVFLGTAVVFGEVLCNENHGVSEEAQTTVLHLFNEHCERQGWRLILASVHEPFVDMVRKYEQTLPRPGNIVVSRCGEELVFDPKNWESMLQGRSNADLRRKVNKARKSDLTFHEHHRQQYTEEMKKRDLKMLQLRDEWMEKQSHKRGKAYLCMARLFEEPFGRRWFYCSDAIDDMQGIAVVSRMDVYGGGYLLEHLIIRNTAPVGTSEYLVCNVMREVYRSENCRYMTFGPDSSNDILQEISGMYRWLAKMSQSAFQWMLKRGWFDVESKLKFRSKFQPVQSVKAYVIAYHTKMVSPLDGLAILKTVNVLGRRVKREMKWLQSEEALHAAELQIKTETGKASVA